MKSELLSILAYDGYKLETKLNLPDDGNIGKLVLFINASGPFTYNTKRQNQDGSFFYYFDLFADEFTKRGIAFCSYSTRGVKDGDEPPCFVEIDDAKYKKYLPLNSVSDVECIVKCLLDSYKFQTVNLLGWSEGTIIAPLIALSGNVPIDALLLAGYCNENLRDTLIWQLSGNSTLINWRRLFDYDRKSYITESDFEEDRLSVRKALFGDMKFNQLDRNGDGRITVEDTALFSVGYLNNMLDAINRGDDEWLKSNYGIRLTSGWFKEHFLLEPNKTTLPKLDLPIHIFAGEYDANTPYFQAFDIDEKFKKLGKTNLTLHTFENHDHDLNYMQYILKAEIPKGIKAIFNTAEDL